MLEGPGDRAEGWLGRALERVEDAALLTGSGRYLDDLGVKPGTLQMAILRSPHAHADIRSIDTTAARALAASNRESGVSAAASSAGMASRSFSAATAATA